MTEEDRQVAEALRERLLAAAGPHIRKIIIFGSRARGDAEPDSDLDAAVLVDRRTAELEEALDDAAYEFMWERDFSPIVSLKVFAADQFQERLQEGFSFYRKVVREGVTL